MVLTGFDQPVKTGLVLTTSTLPVDVFKLEYFLKNCKTHQSAILPSQLVGVV